MKQNAATTSVPPKPGPVTTEAPLHSLDMRPEHIPNEPMTTFINIGNFYSVDYLTSKKIIGVGEAGTIYCAEDGVLWRMLRRSVSFRMWRASLGDSRRVQAG